MQISKHSKIVTPTQKPHFLKKHQISNLFFPVYYHTSYTSDTSITLQLTNTMQISKHSKIVKPTHKPHYLYKDQISNFFSPN